MGYSKCSEQLEKHLVKNIRPKSCSDAASNADIIQAIQKPTDRHYTEDKGNAN